MAVRTGFRANSNRSGTTPARDWRNYPDQKRDMIERLRGVTIEHRDAAETMAAHDGPNTLHFVDPPYLPETRSKSARRADGRAHVYAHELTESDHADLLAFLRSLQGMVVLCGYPAETYDRALEGWHRVERQALADGARKRTEVLWINPAARDRAGDAMTLFDGGM